MQDLIDDRIAVTASTRTLGVSITMGDTLVALTLAAPSNVRDLDEAGLRAAALRLASRALDVSQEELRQEQGQPHDSRRGS